VILQHPRLGKLAAHWVALLGGRAQGKAGLAQTANHSARDTTGGPTHADDSGAPLVKRRRPIGVELERDPSLVTGFRRAGIVLALTAMALGGVVLAGWALEARIVIRLFVPGPAMPANSALVAVLAGLSIWLLRDPSAPGARKMQGVILALVVALIGGITLVEHALGWSGGIDEWLFRDGGHLVQQPHPGRPSPMAALNFVLWATAILLTGARSMWGPRVGQLVALTSFALILHGAYALLLRGPGLFVSLPPYRGVTAPGVAMGLLLTTAILFCRPERGVMASLCARGIGGLVLRRGMVLALLLPAALGWLSVAGERTGLYPADISISLMTLAIAATSVPMLWFGARMIGTVEARLRQAENSERQRAARLEEAQQLAHIGSWQLDLRNNLLTWSAEIYRMFDIDPPRFGATYEAFLNAIHPDDREAVNRAYTESVAKHTPYAIEHRLRMADGRIKFVHEQGETFYDADGKPIRSAGTVQDITERKQAEAQIRQLNATLEQRVRERTAQLETAVKDLESFSYSVSHDLRAPLRAVDNFSNILAEEYGAKLDDEGRRLIKIVRDSTTRMAQLIDDILLFSRAGRRELAIKHVDMAALAREVFDELRLAEPSRHVELQIGTLPDAQADAATIRQVWANLLANALKFTRGRDPARIDISGSVQDGESRFTVRDNGAGFDPRYADKLFGVFQRLHTKEQFEGTGIGLAIVKRIVDKHGGRVWAEGAPDQGASFHFALPEGRVDARGG
jgi:PAS domain S-box-containing protein